jgi:alkyl sulfatase BDS1-like metallo-beta-lactamase superfamily hydrolase
MDNSDLRRDASAATSLAHQSAAARVARGDDTDFERVSRGLIAGPPSDTITGKFGQAVWDFSAWEFARGDAAATVPATVNPSLWRQARLNAVAGLFRVTDGVYQVRGFDISNITLCDTDTGWVVIDPLTSEETAAAAMALAREHLGDKPVRAIIYTHSHTDHFGGVRGVVGDNPHGVPIIAPKGFLEAAVSENVIAGTAMLRRATYMYGMVLPKDVKGHVDVGLGKAMPALPSVGLLAPTDEVVATGDERVIDGLRIVFQVTPGTEAPAEMNFFLPQRRALCMAENCTANLHNVYTPRGAQIRDALGWSKYINESVELYGADSDVLFASHHWPRFGHDELVAFLESQRDLYRFIHDQTMRLANLGCTMDEIAERLELPTSLGDEFFNRDYYGTVRHNAKAVYQRYLGFFDGNPAHLNAHEPTERARRYVAFIGGADALLAKARVSFDEGDYRFVADVVNHLVFAEPTNEAARLLQADALEQLGYQAESGPWRDFYLTAAMELRQNGTLLKGLGRGALQQDYVQSMTTAMLVDLMGVRLDGPRAAQLSLRCDLVITDRDERSALTVRHGAVSLVEGRHHQHADVSLSITHSALASLLGGQQTLDDLITERAAEVTGDRGSLDAVLDCLVTFSIGFEIVLPD